MILRPGYLPNMYVIGLLPFAALVVAGTSEALWRTWRSPSARLFPAGVAALAVVGVLAFFAPVVATRWAHGAESAMTVRLNGPQHAAERWILDNVGRDKRLIVGDEFWIYLVEHGFDHSPMEGGFFSRTVVAYWPLDYDPAVKKHFPNGWRDFDYVVSTEAVRITMNRTPSAARAVENSRVVARFGRGAGRIEIRAIVGGRASG
jgi:hypothetical protein